MMGSVKSGVGGHDPKSNISVQVSDFEMLASLVFADNHLKNLNFVPYPQILPVEN